MAGKRDAWNKAGRILTGVVVLCFFLPFFGISCNGMEVVKISGADMVFGCKPGGMVSEMKPEEGMGEVKVENVKREPLAIVAFALALAVFGLAWVRKKPAMIGAGLLSLAAVGALAGLYVKANGDLDDAMKAQQPGSDGTDAPSLDVSDFDKDIEVDAGARMGFWVTCLGFLGIAVWTSLALREKDLPEFPPPPPPPTPPPSS